jgi:hypothetical protein
MTKGWRKLNNEDDICGHEVRIAEVRDATQFRLKSLTESDHSK